MTVTTVGGDTPPLPSTILMPTLGPSSGDASKWSSVESTTLYMNQGFLTVRCTCKCGCLAGFMSQHVCTWQCLDIKILVMHVANSSSLSFLCKPTSHSKNDSAQLFCRNILAFEMFRPLYTPPSTV